MKQLISNPKIITRISLILTILYGFLVLLLATYNNLFQDIYQNNVWMELSFVLFITYLIIYIKDAAIHDYIDIFIQKEDKAFLNHLIEHTLEPIVIFLLFICSTYLLLLFQSNGILLRLFCTILTPLLYFTIKKNLLQRLSNKQ